MSKHEREQPKPDPTLNGSSPHPEEEPLPPEDPEGKHEKKDDD